MSKDLGGWGGKDGKEWCYEKGKVYTCWDANFAIDSSVGLYCLDLKSASAAACSADGKRILCGGISFRALYFACRASRMLEMQSVNDNSKEEMALRSMLHEGFELLTEIVQSAYMQALGRVADSAGLENYRFEMLEGKILVEELHAILNSSDEHKSMVSSKSHRKKSLILIDELAQRSHECKHSGNAEKGQRLKERQTDLDNLSMQKSGFWCKRGEGYPLLVYQYVNALRFDLLSFQELVQAYPKTLTTVFNAASEVEQAYKEVLQRFPKGREVTEGVEKFINESKGLPFLKQGLFNSPEFAQLKRMSADKLPVRIEQAEQIRQLLKRFLHSEHQVMSASLASIGLRELQLMWNRHGPVLQNQQALSLERWRSVDGVVPIGMYVGNRPEYFSQVIEALRKVVGIQHSFIIISMDQVTEAMLTAVLAIDFAPFRLLFHPEPEGLVWGIGGYYHSILAIKNHWRFLINHIFKFESALSGFDGEIVLLEEDHRPTPDLMITLSSLIRLKNDGEFCAACWGVHLKWGCEQKDKEHDINMACRVKWFRNTGLSFNRTIFARIEISTFEEFRDGWDYSLYHIIQTQQLLPCQPLCVPHMVAPAVARIANIGRHGATVDETNVHEIEFPTVPDDIAEKGFDGSQMYLAQYFKHGGSTDDAMYMGIEDKWIAG